MHRYFCTVALTAIVALSASAATFSVTSGGDNGPGTLRQAILDANATPGHDSIVLATSVTVNSALPAITDPVDLDGGAGALNAAVAFADPVVRFAPGSSGSNLHELYFRENAPNVILIDPGVSNVTIDQILAQFMELSGTVDVRGDDNIINRANVDFLLISGDRTTVVNSRPHYITINGAANTRIGRPGEQNLILAIDITDGPGTIVEGNRIGYTFDASPGLQATTTFPQPGITVIGNIFNPRESARIGAANSLFQRNTLREGAISAFGAHGVEITENTVTGGFSRAISLDADTNDSAPDADVGPNNRQNFPILTSAVLVDGALVVDGTLTSAPLTPYRIEFFSNSAGDPRMRTFLGSLLVNTDQNGSTVFRRTFTASLPLVGEWITATATNKGLVPTPGNSPNDTSQVSAPAVVAPATNSAAVPTASTWALLVLVTALAAIAVLRQ